MIPSASLYAALFLSATVVRHGLSSGRSKLSSGRRAEVVTFHTVLVEHRLHLGHETEVAGGSVPGMALPSMIAPANAIISTRGADIVIVPGKPRVR